MVSFRILAENRWHTRNWARGGGFIYKKTLGSGLEPQGIVLEPVAHSSRVITTLRSKGARGGGGSRIRRRRELCRGGHHDRSNDFYREKQAKQPALPKSAYTQLASSIKHINSYPEQV